MKLIKTVFLCIATIGHPNIAQGKTIYLKDGSIIEGIIIKQDLRDVVIRTLSMGEVEIPRTLIVQDESDFEASQVSDYEFDWEDEPEKEFEPKKKGRKRKTKERISLLNFGHSRLMLGLSDLWLRREDKLVKSGPLARYGSESTGNRTVDFSMILDVFCYNPNAWLGFCYRYTGLLKEANRIDLISLDVSHSALRVELSNRHKLRTVEGVMQLGIAAGTSMMEVKTFSPDIDGHLTDIVDETLEMSGPLHQVTASYTIRFAPKRFREGSFHWGTTFGIQASYARISRDDVKGDSPDFILGVNRDETLELTTNTVYAGAYLGYGFQ